MHWLHRYLKLLAVVSLVLITAGGLVTSTGSGLAVPDWPNSYGYFMFSFPLSNMVGGIFYEHGHRLIASTVGLMTIVLAVWMARVDSRPWMRRLGWVALVTVSVQGILGGITVLYFLPTPVSVGHAGLAQLFFGLIIGLAVVTSPGWLRRFDRPHASGSDRRSVADDRVLSWLSVMTPVVVYIQILIGATMRHTGAGLAIPDFPLAFGRLVPPVWDQAIAVHYLHRVGALLVTGLIVTLVRHVWAYHRPRPELRRPCVLLGVTVAVQVFLGAWTVLSERNVAVNTAHVTTGAVLFVTTLVLMLRVHHDRVAAALRGRSSLPETLGQTTRDTSSPAVVARGATS